ncbi:hypothetical protein V757_01970 [Pelistega indica]|uniref:Uncharacterized protein n=1 Tax=Pelistega indica TaxID=1414851 RepID=V8G8T0_9BURK|nr:hypothetical protein [Pelistega indica]ETD72830.1 hypothetical protein V757_01970 [Pelistega indica]
MPILFTLIITIGTIANGFIFTLTSPHTVGFYLLGTSTACLMALFVALVVSHLERLFGAMEGK